MSSIAAPSDSIGTDQAYQIMLVDDSAVIRGLFRRTLDPDPEIDIVASVANGQQAIDALRRQSIEVIVLDIEMPVMDGLTALPQLLKIDPDVKIVMASTLTQQNAETSMKALSLGATDYIPKPTARHEIHSAEAFKRELLEKVKTLGFQRRKRGGRKQPSVGARPAARAKAPAAEQSKSLYEESITLRKPSVIVPQILCIGSSTGGPPALMNILTRLKGDLEIPILITQHMPKTFTAILAQHIGKISGCPCAEGVDGETIERGRIYIAPGAMHMVVDTDSGRNIIRIEDGPPENFCKPAVDPMLRSVAKVYGPKALVAILTGMGHDGLAGARTIIDAGGTLLAQDEDTSVVWGMPGSVATAGLCSAVVPLNEIAMQIRKIAGKPVS